MTSPVVMGLDLSLAGTGIATRVSCWHHKTKGQRGDSYAERGRRIVAVRDWVIGQTFDIGPDLVCLEGPSYASASTSAFDRAKLWWDVYEALGTTYKIPVAVIPPTSRAKYATGSGNSNKQKVIIAAARRLTMLPIEDDNEADACWLMAMGADWLGHPLVDVPQAHGTALNGVDWPARTGRLAA